MMFNENTKVRLGYLGTMEGKDMYENARNNTDHILSFYKNIEPDTKRRIDMDREFFKVKVNENSYYFFARTNGVDIFVEMPLVENDELFDWNLKYWGTKGKIKTLWAQLRKGTIKFNCTYYLESKNTTVRIMIGRVFYKSLWIQNGTNKDILEAIEDWLNEFRGQMSYSLETEPIKKENKYW